MAAPRPHDDVELVKSRIDIVDVVSRYVKLKRAGKNLSGLCPFHRERTPSFTVSPERQTFKCFGCGAGGDVLTFIQEIEGVEFREALSMLAERAGVTLSGYNSSTKGGGTKKKRALTDVLANAATLYHKEVYEHQDVLDYLKSRGVREADIQKWQIGYAPKSWSWLQEKLATDTERQKLLYEAGLLKQGREHGYYDTFRQRITFPIWNAEGKVVGISGRAYGDEEPKYLNSPETVVFQKSQVLYGYNKAKESIRRMGYAVLVEGQFDLIMAHAAGVTNAVATSGTAVTEKHISLLSRMTKRLLLLLDSDDAGRAAARKSARLALAQDFSVKVALLPEGKDPADIVAEDKEKLKEHIKKSVDTFLGREYSNKNQTEQNEYFQNEILPSLAAIPGNVQTHKAAIALAQNIGVPVELILSDLRSQEEAPARQESVMDDKPTQEKKESRFQKLLLTMLSHLREYKERDDARKEYINAVEEKLSELVGEKYLAGAQERAKNVETTLLDNPEQYLWDALERLERELLEREAKVLAARAEKQRLAEPENSASVDEILKEWRNIQSKIQALPNTYANAYKEITKKENNKEERR